jgi:magnesium transporter
VTDARARLEGRVALHALLAAGPAQTLGDIMDADPARVAADADQEQVALAAIAHAVGSVPVVGGDGALLGVVPATALLGVLRREHEEDMHRLVGIQLGTAQARDALEAPAARQARSRIPWLLVGLGGTLVSALLMARFERLLAANVAVAFFLPAIVYLADAIGTQTETVVVRGLSVVHAPLPRLFVREVSTGVLIGLLLAALIYPPVAVILGDPRLALAVALAVLAAGSLAAAIGLLLPWTLSYLGRDPALGSGPLATIVQDILSLLVYLATASLLLS